MHTRRTTRDEGIGCPCVCVRVCVRVRVDMRAMRTRCFWWYVGPATDVMHAVHDGMCTHPTTTIHNQHHRAAARYFGLSSTAAQKSERRHKYRSELLSGGVVKWSDKAAAGGQLELSFDVNWQALVQTSNRHELLEFQTLVASAFVINKHSQVRALGTTALMVTMAPRALPSDAPLIEPGYLVPLSVAHETQAPLLRCLRPGPCCGLDHVWSLLLPGVVF